MTRSERKTVRIASQNGRLEEPRLDYDEASYFDYQRSRAADEETFLQEYCCIPGDDAAAFLTFDLIDAVQYRHEDSREWGIVRIERGTMDVDLRITRPPKPLVALRTICR